MVETLRDLLIRQPTNASAVSLAAQALEHGGSRKVFGISVMREALFMRVKYVIRLSIPLAAPIGIIGVND